MSKYSTQLRYLVESLLSLKATKNYTNVDEVIKDGAELLFNFNYPIFNEEYRAVLNEKILRHYWNMEIGFETVGAFRFALEEKMQLIMPTMNKFYESALIEFNPLHEIDLTTESTKDNVVDRVNESSSSAESTTSGTSSNTGNDLNKFSDAPKNNVTDIDVDKYLTNATKVTTDSKGTTSASGKSNNTGKATDNETGNETYKSHVTGRQGKTASQLIQEYRGIILNVDLMVFKELDELFMLLW